MDWSPRRPGSSPPRRAAPTLVIFGGGYTLYALNAATGAVYWGTTTPGVPPSPEPRHGRDPHLLLARGGRRGGHVRGRRRRRQGLRGLRGGGEPRHRRPGLGVPDRRRPAGPGARQRVRQCVVVGDAYCPSSASWCSAPPTATSPTPRRWPSRSSPCGSATGQLAWRYRPPRPDARLRLGLRGHAQRRGRQPGGRRLPR